MDPRRDMPGRGAWIHPDSACIDKARQRRSLGRLLRVTTEIGDNVWEDLAVVARQATPRASTNDERKRVGS